MIVMQYWKPASVLAGQLGKAIILAYAGDGRTLIVKGDLMGFDKFGVTLLLEVTSKERQWYVIPWHRVQTIQSDPEIQE